MNTIIPRKLIALASGVALAMPVWAAAAASTNAASVTRLERLERLERAEKLEKLQKLERLEKEAKVDRAQQRETKLDQAQKARVAGVREAKAYAAQGAKLDRTGKPDVIAEAARFDSFLKANPQIAGALGTNPDLIDSASFMAKYPVLTAWLNDHPNVAKELKANPTELLKVAVDLHSAASSPAFKAMSSTGISLGEVTRFDFFLSSHPNIAKELKSNPSLITSDAFMAKNPALSAWLTAHPDIAKELQTNPQVFLKLSVDLYAQLNTLGLVTLI